MNNHDEHLRYPVGRFAPRDSYTTAEVKDAIMRIQQLPDKVKAVVAKLDAALLDTPYREGGWTARQVVHHLADSHTNAYIRFKWTMTEETPTIKAYDEKAWAETPETKLDPQISLNFLEALHVKWVSLLYAIPAEDLMREFKHPETGKFVSIARMIATYAWHGEHHLGHLNIVAGKK